MTQIEPTQPHPNHGGAITSRVAAAVLLLLLLALAALWSTTYLATRGRVPTGVSVAGVDISGMTTGAARRTLQEELGSAVIRPFEVHAGPLTASVDPLQAGLTANWVETVRAAGVSSGNPFSLAAGLFGSRHTDLPVATDVDEEKLSATLSQLEHQLARTPADGQVTIVDRKVMVVDSRTGISVNRDRLHDAIVETWLDPEPVEVPPVVTQPDIPEDEIKAAAAQAESAVSENLVAKGKGGEGLIPADRMEDILTFELKDGAFTPVIDSDLVGEILAEGLDRTVQDPVDAKVRFVNGKKSVVPAQKGRTVNWEKTLKDFPDRLFGTKPKTWDAIYDETDAGFTTEEAEKLNFNDTLGKGTERAGTRAAGSNSSLMAELVDGAVIMPGGRFSLNSTTGPRNASQGFSSPASGDDDGGYGQFATALYNAALQAGMTDFTRSAHTHYNDLYEAGLDATVAPGKGDLAFTNPFDTPVVILAQGSSSRVTVSIKGVKNVTVTITPGPVTDTTPAPGVISDADNCVPGKGRDGFTTRFTRTVKNLSGKVISQNTVTTVYTPEPAVTCIEKQREEAPPAETEHADEIPAGTDAADNGPREATLEETIGNLLRPGNG